MRLNFLYSSNVEHGMSTIKVTGFMDILILIKLKGYICIESCGECVNINLMTTAIFS